MHQQVLFEQPGQHKHKNVKYFNCYQIMLYKLTALFDSEWGGRLVCCESSHSPSLPELLSGTCHLSTPLPPLSPPLHSSQVDGTIHSNQTPNAEAKITWPLHISLFWSHSQTILVSFPAYCDGNGTIYMRLYLSLQ